MDAPELRTAISESEMRHATGNSLYRVFHDTAMANMFGGVGQLRWRIAMVVVTIGVLFVPLRKSLLQLKNETISRTAAREAVHELVAPDHLLSQQLEILPDRLIQNLITTTPVDKQRVATIEAELSRKIGKPATIQVRQVANEEELATLRERLLAPVETPPPPPPPGLKSLASTTWPLLDKTLQAIWPADTLDLSSSEVGFTKDGVLIRLGYQSPKEMDAAAQEVIEKALAKALEIDKLNVIFEWRRGPISTVKAIKK
jgi:hypothetical protein